jgi:hypothetical protein
MKRKYNTLNEEMNRMKSLFGESRLYGNLVDGQEENIISEQYKFLQKLKNLGKIKLTSFEDIKVLEEFINREITNVGDMIKHIDDFDAMWKTIIPQLNTVRLKKSLAILEEVADADQLKNIPEDIFLSKVLPSYPKKGGMRDMVYDMWLSARGESRLLPATIETRIVKLDDAGGLVVPTNAGDVNIAQIRKADDTIPLEYFDDLGEEIDPEIAKKGGKKLYDVNGDEIDFSGKKVDVDSWEEGMIVFNDAGDEVGTYNKHGEIIDSKGNIVDKNGKIITKVEDIPTDADIVSDASADGTPSQMDGNTYTNNNGNLEKVEKSFGDAQQKDGGLMEEVTNLNEKAFEDRKMAFEDRKMAHEERMKDKNLSEEDKALKQRQMDLEEKKFEFEVKQYEDALKEKKKVSVVVTPENVDAVKKTFREKIGLTGKFFDFIFWPLSIKDGDNGLKRIAKQTGSAVVDPLGVLGWFRQFNPPNPKLVYAPKNANWHRIFRGVFGTGFNLMLWNIIMWKGFKDADYRIDKILPTYWTNIKNNWVTQVGRMFLHWALSDQFTEMCQELKESSGKDCNEWLTSYGDDIEKHLKSYIDGKDCDALKAMRDSNGNLERVEYGNAAKYITGEYNKEMNTHIGAGWIEDFMEWAMGWKTDITNLTANAFETYEIDVTNGGGKTEKFNAIDYYFAQALMEKCGAEYQESQTPVETKEVVVEGTVIW